MYGFQRNSFQPCDPLLLPFHCKDSNSCASFPRFQFHQNTTKDFTAPSHTSRQQPLQISQHHYILRGCITIGFTAVPHTSWQHQYRFQITTTYFKVAPLLISQYHRLYTFLIIAPLQIS